MRQEAIIKLHTSQILMRETEDLDVLATFTIPGEPASKARPRFDGRGSKTRTYTPAKTLAAEEAVGWLFRQAKPGHRADDERTFGLAATFYASDHQRRDVDNMIKLLCDGLNGIAWKDDVQVSEVSGRRFVGAEVARTEVCIYVTGAVVHQSRGKSHAKAG